MAFSGKRMPPRTVTTGEDGHGHSWSQCPVSKLEGTGWLSCEGLVWLGTLSGSQRSLTAPRILVPLGSMLRHCRLCPARASAKPGRTSAYSRVSGMLSARGGDLLLSKVGPLPEHCCSLARHQVPRSPDGDAR